MLRLGLRETAVITLVALFAYGCYLESKERLSDGMLWLLGWVLLAADLILSLLPAGEPNDALRLYDKVVHVVAYGALVVVFLLAAVWRPRRGFGRWEDGAAVVVLALVIFGGAVELLQSFLGRDLQVFDILANAIGSLFGLVLWRALAVNRSEAGSPRART